MSIREEVIELSYKNRNLYNVIFELTETCNWECRHCYLPGHNESGLSKEKIFDIFMELREAGVFELTLTGGEIFTRKDILEIIAKAREMHFKLILFSNISLLNEEMIKFLAECHISEISCTIFSLNAKVHDFITGRKGSLKQVLQNIELIQKYNIPLTIKSIITNLNFRDWVEIKEYCERNKFSYNIDHDVFSKRNGSDEPWNLRMTGEQYRMEIEELDSLRGFTVRQHNQDEYVCMGIQNSLFIDNGGKVYPCSKFLYFLGDLNKDKISDIWKKSKELKRIQDMKWRDLPECSCCDKSAYCNHCPGTSMLENGSEYARSTLACDKAGIRKELYNNK